MNHALKLQHQARAVVTGELQAGAAAHGGTALADLAVGEAADDLAEEQVVGAQGYDLADFALVVDGTLGDVRRANAAPGRGGEAGLLELVDRRVLAAREPAAFRYLLAQRSVGKLTAKSLARCSSSWVPRL